MKGSAVVRVFTRAVLFSGMILSAVLSAAQAPPPVSVTTWHNDNWRTGQNTNEINLTTGANGKVNKSTFGLLCKLSFPSTPQQEQAYAQPLVVANSDGSMTAYVATMQDYVYAFSIPTAANWTNSSCADNGIVWAINSDGSTQNGNPAVLYALDAQGLTELYDSNQCGTADQPGPATKYSVPTIANGYVFIGTQTDFDIYGVLPSIRQCQ
jgi:hypothetical protein